MDVMENLVELLRNAFAAYGDGITGCTREEFLADFIVGDGVTVQEWIPVTERLPETMQPVIVCREGGKVEQGYKDVGDWWKVYGTRTKHVTHWMPLPEPPKEG